MGQKHRVVILGGGFGGLNAARALKRAPVEITLLDRRNFHLFQPLLYQVATGSLSPGEIAAPLRSVLSRQKNAQVLLGDVVDVDPEARRVILRDGSKIPYDSLIVATGSQPSYYGHDEWREWGPSLKTVEDATAIRHKVFCAFERAERCEPAEEVRSWLTFVIVGAGATGLELAGALAEIARNTLRHDFRKIRPEEARILLIEGGPRVLPAYPEDLSASAEKLVARLGVEVLKNVEVTQIDEQGVTYRRGEEASRVAARTVLWTGGVQATEFGRKLAERTGAETDRGGRIKVGPELTVPKFPQVFVIGDLALALREDGRPLPGVAPVAMQEGTYVAKAIRTRLGGATQLAPFHYREKGDLAVIGRAAAVANIFGVHLAGWPAWLVWLFIHLMYIVEFQNRVLVFIQWGFEYLTFSRGARLITGVDAEESTGKSAGRKSATSAR
jgi:NADH dehydrogenase